MRYGKAINGKGGGWDQVLILNIAKIVKSVKTRQKSTM